MQNHTTATTLDDDSLVLLAQQGDNLAFTELIERHYKGCVKVATSILHDHEDAADEVQNACWKAYENITRFQRDARFSTWFTRIVVNQCLMKLRKQRREKLVYVDDVASQETHAMDLPSRDATPEVTVAEGEIANLLRYEIRRIPPLLRNVFLLRDVQELPMEDVAIKLGISVAAAKSRLLRARTELRNRFRKHEGRLGPATLFA